MAHQDSGDAAEGRIERWPNRRVFVVAAIVTLIILAIHYLPAAVVNVFNTIRDTIIVLILAVTMTYILVPVVDLFMRIEWPEKKRTRRQLYAVVSLVLFIAILIGLIVLIVTPLTQQLGVAVEAVTEWVSEDLGETVNRGIESIISVVPEEYQDDVRDQIESLRESFGADQSSDLVRRWGGTVVQWQLTLLQTIISSGAYLVGLVVVPILTYYFLTDADLIRKGVARHIPLHARKQFHDTVQEIDCMLRAYVRTIIVVAAITGVTTGLLLLFAGVPAYLPLGALTGLGAMIPVLGPVVAVSITMIVTLLTVGFARAAIVLLIYGGIEIASDRVLAPELMAEGVGLHPVAVILALMIGGQYFGVIGVFVAVPATATLRLIYVNVREYLSDEEHREELDKHAGPKNGDEDD